MRKPSTRKLSSELVPEYDLRSLGPGVKGKYLKRATEAGNLVLIEPDLVQFFRDAASVNRVLRVVAEAARAAITSRKRSGWRCFDPFA
jgi:hypothetical protein